MKNVSLLGKSFKEPDETYSLINEPLVLMKNHLLSNYENFLFIIYENPIGNLDIKAYDNEKNKIILINEKSLFDLCTSERLTGKNNALPIVMEFFHAKTSLRNLNINSPLISNKNIESLFGDNLFILNLKNPENKLGELLDEDYFTDENFDKLHSKAEGLLKNNNIKNIQKNTMNISNQNKNDLKDKIKNPISLEDFENLYLVNGIFIYPDSLPFHEHYYGEKPVEISQGEKEYLKKYESQIIKGRKLHLGED